MFQKRSEERKPMRWKQWDYSNEGYYFVTLCTKGMEEFFGEIQDGIMGLNELGVIANQCWLDIPHHFDGVELDEYVVMPNHVHGVIAIQSSNVGGRHANDNNISVGDRHACPLRLNRK